MRKIFAAILLSLSMIAGPVLMSSPAEAAGYRCSNKIDRVGHTFKDDRRSVYVQGTVFYRYCVNSKNRAYVKPYRVINTYNASGSYMTCDKFNRYLDGVTFNWYFWRPYNGANFNPGGVSLRCDPSTLNTKDQDWNTKNVPRLYFGPGHGNNRQPRWKVNVTLKRNMNFDKNWAHGQDFKPFR